MRHRSPRRVPAFQAGLLVAGLIVLAAIVFLAGTRHSMPCPVPRVTQVVSSIDDTGAESWSKTVSCEVNP